MAKRRPKAVRKSRPKTKSKTRHIKKGRDVRVNYPEMSKMYEDALLHVGDNETIYEDGVYNKIIAKGYSEALKTRFEMVKDIQDADHFAMVREHMTNLIELTLDSYKSALKASGYLERISEMPTHDFTAQYKKSIKGMSTKIRSDVDRYLGTMERGFIHLQADAVWSRKRERDCRATARIAKMIDKWIDSQEKESWD